MTGWRTKNRQLRPAGALSAAWPRGATPHLRSGAEAESAKLQWHRNSRDELLCIRGQGRQLRGATGHPRPRAVAGRSHPMPEARDGGWEEQPHARGQGRLPGGSTPRPRSGGCAGVRGPREAIPCLRSGRVVMRRQLSSKVRSSGCGLLDQP